MAKALYAFWNWITKVAPKTQICNNTNQHIFLIPLSCLDGYDPRTYGKVKDDGLVKVIPPRDSIQVNSRKYDCNPINPNSQIYILFRTGDDDDVQKFLRDLRNEFPQGVQVQQGEQLFLHLHLLRYPQFLLNCNGAGQVIREVNNAGQVDAAVTGNESDLVNNADPVDAALTGNESDLVNQNNEMQDNNEKLIEELRKIIAHLEVEIKDLRKDSAK